MPSAPQRLSAPVQSSAAVVEVGRDVVHFLVPPPCSAVVMGMRIACEFGLDVGHLRDAGQRRARRRRVALVAGVLQRRVAALACSQRVARRPAAPSVPSRVRRRAPCTVWVSWQFRQAAFHTGRPAGNSRSAAAASR
jgi:hypothetical protein